MRGARGRSVAVLAALLLLAGCGDAAPELGPTRTLAEAGASNPTVALAPDGGVAYVAWVGTEDGRSDVWLRAVPAVGEPRSRVRVNDVPGDAQPHAQAPARVAVGPEGNVYVAWTNATIVEGRPFPASDLRFARSTDGGRSFEPAFTVNDDHDDPGAAPASHTFHELVVAPDGAVIVSWLDSRREWNPDGVHGAHAHAGPSFDPAVPGPDVRIAVSRDGGRSFGQSAVVDQQACPCCRTTLAAGAGGRLHLAWRKVHEGDVRDIVVATSTDGGASFAEPHRVHEDGWVFPGCPHAGPALVVDRAGVLHAVWYTGREDRQGLHYARSTDGGRSFEAPVPLVTGGWVPPSQASLAAGEGGAVWIAWEDRRTPEPVVRWTTLRAGEEGGSVRPADARSVEGGHPSLAVAGGRVALVWLEGERVLYRGGPADP